MRLMALLLPATVCGWATKSQTSFGAQIDEIKAQMRGEAVNRNFQAQLGYLWHMPDDPDDPRGLGGGITWSWDSNLCRDLMGSFREDIYGAGFISCSDAKAAVARAFDKWAANSRHIHFLDVSRECEILGANTGPPLAAALPGAHPSHGGCPLAEIWITGMHGNYASSGRRLSATNESVLTVSETAAGQSGGVVVASALSHLRAVPGSGVSEFRFTNGLSPRIGTSSAPFVETHAGTFSFNARQVCWYLDSEFCAGFHRLKQNLGGVQQAELFVYGWTYGLMSVGLIFYLYLFCAVAWRVSGLELEAEDDEDGDGQLSLGERFNAGLRIMSHWNPLTLTILITVLIVPPLIANTIFQPCFQCYDFEAAALHEIGHFLGLGHPDNIPQNWRAPPNGNVALAGPTQGQNSYQAVLAAAVLNGSRPNFNCTHPWEDVFPGTPPGAATESGGAYPYRNAQMEARTQHNPLSCLMNDDLEALSVLYPDCGSYALSGAVCHTVKLNIGLVRIMVYVITPMIITLLCVVACSTMVHDFERRQHAKLSVEKDEAKHQAVALRFQLGIAKAHTKKIIVEALFGAGSLGLTISAIANSKDTGGKVKSVDKGSQADKEGVTVGSILLAVNGERVTDGSGMNMVRAATRPMTLRFQYEKNTSTLVQKKKPMHKAMIDGAKARMTNIAGKRTEEKSSVTRNSKPNPKFSSVTDDSMTAP